MRIACTFGVVCKEVEEEEFGVGVDGICLVKRGDVILALRVVAKF